MTAEDFEAVIPLVVLAFKARFIAVEFIAVEVLFGFVVLIILVSVFC